MNRRHLPALGLLTATLLSLAACGATPVAWQPPTMDAASPETPTASPTMTVTPIETPKPSPTSTDTPSPSPSPMPTPTPSPPPSQTPTAVPTATPAATATSKPVPTDTPLPPSCKPGAEVVEEIPDMNYPYIGTVGGELAIGVGSGEKFTMIWRVRSSGCADWPRGTVWAFVSGHSMGISEPIRVSRGPVGEIVEIEAEFTAPLEAGCYQGVWQMRGPDGTFFGEQGDVEVCIVPTVPTM